MGSTTALYLLRGLVEFPVTGWSPELLLTVGIGTIVLPGLTASAASSNPWRRTVLLIATALGAAVNAGLMLSLWQGLTPIAGITMIIVGMYAGVFISSYRTTFPVKSI